jgi:predicted membrane GTPase involved in stress response
MVMPQEPILNSTKTFRNTYMLQISRVTITPTRPLITFIEELRTTTQTHTIITMDMNTIRTMMVPMEERITGTLTGGMLTFS